MTYKHKTHAVDSDGKVISNADIDFSIDDVRVYLLFSVSFLVIRDLCSRIYFRI